MLTVLGVWEDGWMEAERTERRLWKQTIQAYAVDRWGMCPVHGGPFTSPTQEPTLRALLDAHPGPKTFLIPPSTLAREGIEGVSLFEYEHPVDATYVFGSAPETMVRFVTEHDDVVFIETPRSPAMFSVAALAAVLHDRLAKAR